jgi:DNA sulfur modification protein DndB
MSNKTFIPAFQCAVGDWKYYIAMMKYGEVARQVNFAYELSSNQDLGQLIQRGLSERTKEITSYLLQSPHRFLGAIVVAAWGGEPQYTPLAIDDPDGFLSGLDREFGVLTFDGTQQYFALDGQHRLKAIRDAIKKDPSIGKEDICVLIVTHYDSEEGRIRTRRLFSNINRNAVKTAAAEDIVLDEDDGFAVLSRRLLDEHPFLKETGRVKVIVRRGDEGLLKLAGNSINRSDASAFTTLPVLYDVIQYLGWDLPGEVRAQKARPSVDVLEESYKKVVRRFDDMLSGCGDVRRRLEEAADARELRGQKGREGEGHPMMRPVVQKAVARVISEIAIQGVLGWDEMLKRLSQLDWRLSAAPWCAVFNASAGTMVGAKENTDLLRELLHVHLSPSSLQAIRRARKNYKDLRNEAYPVSEDQLSSVGISGREQPPESSVAPGREELSEQVERELAAIPRDDSGEEQS